MLVILVNLRRGEPLAAYLVARESIPARLTVAECIHRTCGYDGDCAAGKEPEFHVVRPEIGRRNLRILVQEHQAYPEAVQRLLAGGWTVDGRRLVTK